MSVNKLDRPLVIGGSSAYPLTTSDQIIKADGTRLETENGISVDNAEKLNGKEISYFASAEDASNVSDKVPFKFGIDSNGNYGYIKEGADTVTPFSKTLYVTNSVLDKGTFMGTTSRLTNQYNGAVGFSGTGTVSGVSTSSYIGWKYSLDLTNYNYLVFAHKKVTNHGQCTVLIGNTIVYSNSYGSIDTNWHLYIVDLNGYSGIQDVVFHCGYVDSSGSASSNSYFSNIMFIGNLNDVADWNA